MPRVKERESATLNRSGRVDRFYIRLEKPDDVTPGKEVIDKRGALRLFRLQEGRAWLLRYKFGGTSEECEKAAAKAKRLEEREDKKLVRMRPEDLKRTIAKAEAELDIIKSREEDTTELVDDEPEGKKDK